MSIGTGFNDYFKVRLSLRFFYIIHCDSLQYNLSLLQWSMVPNMCFQKIVIESLQIMLIHKQNNNICLKTAIYVYEGHILFLKSPYLRN